MAERLYGVDPLLDGLVPGLVGFDRNGGRCDRVELPGGHPVIELVGGRRSGRTSVLAALSAAYAPLVPLVRADLAAPDFGDPLLADLPDTRPDGSRLTDLLYLLSYKLGLRVRRTTQPLRFPRLSLGLLAVTAWRPDGTSDDVGAALAPQDLRRAEQRLKGVINQNGDGGPERQARLAEWIQALERAVPAGVSGLGVLEGAGRAALRTAAPRLLRSRVNRGALRWWGDHLEHEQGDAVQKLFAFVRDFRRPGGDQARLEEILISAFVADITHHYGLLRRNNDVPPPLILLDNAHVPLGARLLGPLRRKGADKDEMGPVVVAARLGDATAHRALRQVADPAAALADQVDGILRLGLPALERGDIVRILGASDRPAYLPLLIDRFAGGRAGSARTLAEAADAVPHGGAPDAQPAAPLLDAAAPDGSGTTVERLLAVLLPDPAKCSRLTLLAPALDVTAARRLWTGLHSGDTLARRVDDALELLEDVCWESAFWPSTDGSMPLVADRGLRHLLLHQLRTRTAPERWRQIHQHLRGGYVPQEPPPDGEPGPIPSAYLHHTLALGLTESVVRSLHHWLGRSTPSVWLSAVNVVCAAPRPPAGFEAEAVPDDGPCGGCRHGEPAARDEVVHRAVARLVEALWEQSDPLNAPCPDRIDQVESALRTLHEHEATDAFRQVLRHWSAWLREGVQAPYLTVPEGSGR
ncbi:hypothetical protein OG496_50880 [Streptomyces sp. NBC_00988]|uniref:hypothetical protein n=1 Tax=Streptomyces sp. NBC_00988 TaxID=2903704 RepID=UPI003864CF04|nr:hypothetical protein OG496_50880 [Streptomyces sp. NBC_00988]